MTRRSTITCRIARDRLPLHFYDLLEEGERGPLERHLASCPGCAGEWASTRRALGAVDASSAFPREADVDWAQFARRTVARARAADSVAGRAGRRIAWWEFAWLRPSWGWGSAAAAALLIVTFGVWIGRTIHQGDGAAATPIVSAESARSLQRTIARQGAARYLRDGRSLLVNLIQAPVRCRKSDADFDITLEKQRAHQLLRKKNLYLGSLGGVQDQRLTELVSQLETLLVQVSTMQDCTTGRQIHDLREAIDRRQILLRIDLVTREVEGRRLRV